MIASKSRFAVSKVGASRITPFARASVGIFSSDDTRQQYFSTQSKSGFETVGVLGLGLMGHGICQVAAQSGIHSRVVAYEPEQKYLDSGKSRIEKSVAKLVSKDKLSRDQADQLMGNITFTTDVTELENVDLVVEAVIENLDLKEKVYTELGAACKPETVFASNTSSLSIGEMAAFSGRAGKFVGVHFFNPVQVWFGNAWTVINRLKKMIDHVSHCFSLSSS